MCGGLYSGWGVASFSLSSGGGRGFRLVGRQRRPLGILLHLFFLVFAAKVVGDAVAPRLILDNSILISSLLATARTERAGAMHTSAMQAQSASLGKLALESLERVFEMAPAKLDQGFNADWKVADGFPDLSWIDLGGDLHRNKLDLVLVARQMFADELPESVPEPIVQRGAIRAVWWPDHGLSERYQSASEYLPKVVSRNRCCVWRGSILLIPAGVEEATQAIPKFRHENGLQEVLVADASESCSAVFWALDVLDKIRADNTYLGVQSHEYVD